MRSFVSDLQADSKLFIADYDSYSIRKHNTSVEQLLYLTKIGMLLFDHLLLPAAFFWQSEEMKQVMLRLEEAMACGVIMPVVRDQAETTDVLDYYEHRLEESQKIASFPVFSQPALATELATAENRQAANQLQSVNAFTHLDSSSLRKIYARKWRDDLEYSRDINGMRLLLAQSCLPLDQIDGIRMGLVALSEHPQFSRAFCINYIQNNIPSGRVRDQLEGRTSWLYLRSNADAYNGGFYYSNDPYNGMLFHENIGLLAKTLSDFGLSREMINTLTIRDILLIKSSPEYRNFIAVYRELVQTVLPFQEDIVNSLHSEIEHEFTVENRKKKLYTALSWIQHCSGGIFAGLIINYFSGSTINKPAFFGSLGGSAVPVILKGFGIVNQQMIQRPFVDFKNYVIGEQYRNRIMSGLEKYK